MLKEILLSRLGTVGGGNKWERRRRFRCTDGSESLLEGNEGGWLGRRGRGTRLVERRRSIPEGNSGEAVEVVGDDLIGDRLLSFRVTIVGKQAEGPQLVFHLDANICLEAKIH